MHERCSVCGLKYEREPGYFLGAMYFSYALMIPPTLVAFLVIHRLSRLSYDWAFLCTAGVCLPLVPFVARLARVLWIYLDWKFDPDSE